MNETHEVISAFLDDEPFEPEALASALSEPTGRALLLDLVALRHIVQPDDAMPAELRMTRPRHPRVRAALAAAAVFVALVGGYVMGGRRATTVVSEAPAPTRVVQATTTWQVRSAGGAQ